MNQKDKNAYKFLVKFIGIIALYYLIIAVFGTDYLSPYLNISAWISSGILSLFTNSAYSVGHQIIGDGVSLSLSYGCDGTDQFIVFIAGVLSFPSSLNKKLIGISSGLVAIYFLNLFRIIGLFFVANNDFSLFETFHVVVFPIIFIIISLIFWYIWIKWDYDEKVS